MTITDMKQEDLEKFTDVMMEKSRFLGFYETEEENKRALVQLVIADTYLWVSGSVPIERWLETE